MDLFLFSVEGRETLILLDLLEKTNVNNWITHVIQ
jgi:hypothetical protein